MSERLRESLSALMDDAADDLELARVLRAMDEGEEVSETWSRYHLVSAVLRGGEPGTTDVRGPVAIDVEAPAFAPAPDELADDDAEVAAQGRRGPPAWASFAAAASVTLAIVVALQWPGAGPDTPALASTPAPDTGRVVTDRRSVLTAAVGETGARRPPETLRIPPRFATAPTRPVRSEAERQVDAYMLYHAEYSAANSASGMVPFARYASFEGGRSRP
ncbi:MAG: sigma-E factor negative regulatory protein [Pseudomonadales bacterium]|jgi:sigma-E factor negative regulatory protein RseA|nr:sigma-E factor negative regulatory protein [Pseudomonadales bacterium]